MGYLDKQLNAQKECLKIKVVDGNLIVGNGSDLIVGDGSNLIVDEGGNLIVS